MTPQIQTTIALAIVALAAAWLVWRVLAKRRNSTCGGDCACDARKITTPPKRP